MLNKMINVSELFPELGRLRWLNNFAEINLSPVWQSAAEQDSKYDFGPVRQPAAKQDLSLN